MKKDVLHSLKMNYTNIKEAIIFVDNIICTIVWMLYKITKRLDKVVRI